MRVFVTGATGFIGSATVRELLDTGHEVIGLARSDKAAESLVAAGAKAHRGDLCDLDTLRDGAAAADGVIHTAFNHDFSVSRQDAAAVDRRVIAVMAEALVGSDRPLLITSGTGVRAPGQVATEDTVPTADLTGRVANERLALSFVERGVRASVVCFPPSVHGFGDRGFIPVLINIARTKGVSGYPGEGCNRWAAVHRLDAAHLFRLAVEQKPIGERLHGVGDEGIPVKDIAEAIGHHLNVPVRSIPPDEVASHFGFLGAFFSMDSPASSTITQKMLGWHPAGPGLIADLAQGHYFDAVGATPSSTG